MKPNDLPDECTACGQTEEDAGPMYLDPRPRHPSEPQAVFCRDCAADKFDIGEDETDQRCDTPGPGEILGPCALPAGHGGTLHVGMNGIAWDAEATAETNHHTETTHA